MRAASSYRQGVFLVFLSALSFGALAVLAKLAYREGVNVTTLMFWRFLIATVALAAYLSFTGALGRFRARELLAPVALGAVGYASTTALYFTALRTIPAGVASFLLYLSPAVVAVLAHLVLRERLGAPGLLALALALAGLALMTDVIPIALAALHLAQGVSGAPVGLDRAGALLAVGSAVAYGCSIVAGRRLVVGVAPLRVALGIFAGTALAYGAFGAATGRLAFALPVAAWAYVAFIAVVCTAVAFGLFYLALPAVGAPRTALIATLEPVFTVVIGAFVLSEWLAPLQVGGALLILVAAVVLATARAPA